MFQDLCKYGTHLSNGHHSGSHTLIPCEGNIWTLPLPASNQLPGIGFCTVVLERNAITSELKHVYIGFAPELMCRVVGFMLSSQQQLADVKLASLVRLNRLCSHI